MTDQLHPLTPHHLPFYVVKPGETDVLMIAMGIFLIAAILGIGNVYLRLHSLIFYFYPSTTSAALFFRTVSIVPEGSGRVADVKVDVSAPVKKGDVRFTPDSSKQWAATETAKRKIVEIDARLENCKPLAWSTRC